MNNPRIIQVALKVPFTSLLDYQVPAGWPLPPPGTRVSVTLGNQKNKVAIVIGYSKVSQHKKLKPISAILDDQPLLNETLLTLFKKAAQYYQAPLGEVIHMALPRWFKQYKNKTIPKQYWWRCVANPDTAKPLLVRSKKQQMVFDYLFKNQPVQAKDISHIETSSAAILKQLEKKQLVERSELCFIDRKNPIQPEFQLTKDQQKALDALTEQHHFSSHLLDGITGSGKTEVYIRLIQKHLRQGGQVLVLVPEIGLTPQLFSELSERISGRLAVLHSGLSDGTRARVWHQAQAAQVDVIVATRSGIFAPFKRLSLIVVDEEHDLSYKQQDGIRYSARDLALWRGQIDDIPVVLGSATPSMETLFLAHQGKHQWYKLRIRTNQKSLPKTCLQNTRQQKMSHGLSIASINEIKKHVSSGQQVLVFLNRRGWAPKWLCHDCGWVASCDDCDAYLTFHKNTNLLVCHHCNRTYSIPEFCPDCGSQDTGVMGVGTERVAAGLEQNLAVPILRFDRDTIKSARDWQTGLEVIRNGTPCVIIGTQMLAKGHDFSQLSLVIVVNVDNSFYSADFRATEHLAQLLIQVSGRAGRADTQGEVIIQTENPQQPFFQQLLEQGYESFADIQLKERQSLQFPPFSHMAIIHAQHKDNQQLTDMLRPAISLQQEHPDVVVLGPLPAPIQRKQKLYRQQVVVNANSRKALHYYLNQLKTTLPQKLSWIIDVDPVVLDS